MKLIELILKYQQLYKEADQPLKVYSYTDSRKEVNQEAEWVRKNVEHRRKVLDELGEMSNRIFHALATNYASVKGKNLSLATICEQLGGFHKLDMRNTYQCLCNPAVFGMPPAMGFNETEHPQLQYYKSFSLAGTNMFEPKFEDEETFLVDPYNVKDSTENQYEDYQTELKVAFIKQASTIEA